MTAMEHADLRAFLPHRHPILLVDRVVRCAPGVDIETVKAISGCEPCYADIADGAPLESYRYPEALLLESLVQTAGLLWTATMDRGFKGTLVLAEVRSATFGGIVLPGDVVRHVARLDTSGDNLAIVSGYSEVAGAPVLTVDRLVLASRTN